MDNRASYSDIDFIKAIHKPNSNQIDEDKCIVLKGGLSESELDLEYERMKKELYKKESIFEHRSNKQPNYKVFTESSFNSCFKVQKGDISFQTNCYVPNNLQEIIDDNENFRSIVIYIGIHGAGSSSFTFNTLCSHLKSLNRNMIFISYDLRGHGATYAKDLPSLTYNLEDFTDDTIHVVQHTLNKIFKGSTIPNKSSLVFLGHSLGGSICCNVLNLTNGQSRDAYIWKNNTLGLVLLDIIEEVAIEFLDKMDIVIRKTPTSFPNLKKCLRWHLSNQLPGNYDSAKFSIPYIFKLSYLKEDKYYLERKTNFNDFKPFWDTWFVGLSQNFVNTKGVCKLLILSGADPKNEALDRNLIIGQMQGKYQLNIFKNGGHFIHEDCDFNVALTLHEFVKRNDNRLAVIKTNWKTLK